MLSRLPTYRESRFAASFDPGSVRGRCFSFLRLRFRSVHFDDSFLVGEGWRRAGCLGGFPASAESMVDAGDLAPAGGFGEGGVFAAAGLELEFLPGERAGVFAIL